MKALLHGMQLAPSTGETFDGGDPAGLLGNREDQAGQHPRSIKQNGTSAALTVVAAVLCPGEPNMIAYCLKERRSHVDCQDVNAAVHLKCNLAEIAQVISARGLTTMPFPS
jgi:hypothetical protein